MPWMEIQLTLVGCGWGVAITQTEMFCSICAWVRTTELKIGVFKDIQIWNNAT